MKHIFLDGKIVRINPSALTALSPGHLTGEGVFETMKCHDGKILAWKEHFQRLQRGLNFYKMACPFQERTVLKHIHRVMKCNTLKKARVRVCFWREGKKMRSSIVCQAVFNRSKKIFKAMMSSYRRNQSRTSHIKSIAYGPFLKALQDAKSKGFDEAVLCNKDKQIVEGSRTNIFVIKNGKIYTPPIRCGCLNGITRQIIIQLARKRGLFCQTKILSESSLFTADEVFLTNSLLGAVPVSVIDNHIIGKGLKGELTKMLQEDYHGLENADFKI